MGYTRYYTTSVWVGYDNPKKVKGLSGATIPLYIWHDFMQDLHTGMPNQEFLPPLGDAEIPDNGAGQSNQPAADNGTGQATQPAADNGAGQANQPAADDGAD